MDKFFHDVEISKAKLKKLLPCGPNNIDNDLRIKHEISSARGLLEQYVNITGVAYCSSDVENVREFLDKYYAVLDSGNINPTNLKPFFCKDAALTMHTFKPLEGALSIVNAYMVWIRLITFFVEFTVGLCNSLPMRG